MVGFLFIYYLNNNHPAINIIGKKMVSLTNGCWTRTNKNAHEFNLYHQIQLYRLIDFCLN